MHLCHLSCDGEKTVIAWCWLHRTQQHDCTACAPLVLLPSFLLCHQEHVGCGGDRENNVTAETDATAKMWRQRQHRDDRDNSRGTTEMAADTVEEEVVAETVDDICRTKEAMLENSKVCIKTEIFTNLLQDEEGVDITRKIKSPN